MAISFTQDQAEADIAHPVNACWLPRTFHSGWVEAIVQSVTVDVVARSVQTLSVQDRRLVASWAADCAEDVRTIYETAVPNDSRVRDAIAQTRAFASGELPTGEAIRRRGGAAGSAAREAPTSAAKAAAYAAQQAAAVAHMGAHALGAAGYAARAAALVDDRDSDEAVRSVACSQVATMSTAVANALSLLPALGEDRAGPLGPGRLTSGQVGEAIRAIQAQLGDR